jgi:hypothetical protein
MWAKIVIWVLFITVICVANIIINAAVQPEMMSDIALQQFEKSDQVAIEMRAFRSALAVRVGLSLLVGVAGTCLIFLAEIKKCVAKCMED